MDRFLGLLVCWLLSFSVLSEEIKLKAGDGFQLVASLVQADKPAKHAVLMLHQCNANKSMYQGLAEKLAKSGVASLALDFRGYGGSVTPEVDQSLIKKNGDGRESYVKLMRPIVEHWPSDVEVAYQFLKQKLGSNLKVAIIGASCGGGQIVEIAQKYEFSSFVFFSTGFDSHYAKLYHSVRSVPALIVAADGDTGAFKSANKMFDLAQNKHTRLVQYKGKLHGRSLFEYDKNLESLMVDWFKVNFSR